MTDSLHAQIESRQEAAPREYVVCLMKKNHPRFDTEICKAKCPHYEECHGKTKD